MDEKDKPNSIFPPEFAYLEDSLRLTQGKLLEIDQRIANLPEDRNHRQNFKPPGDYKTNDRGKKLSRREELEQDKQQVIKEYTASTEIRLKFTTPEQSTKVMEVITYQLSDNNYKNKERQELKLDQMEQKSFLDSYDYMSAQHYAQFGTLGKPLKEHESAIHNPKYNIDKMGQRFLNKLSYPKKEKISEQGLTQDKGKQEASYKSLISAKERKERDLDKE